MVFLLAGKSKEDGRIRGSLVYEGVGGELFDPLGDK
jgi:hypothetical protein